MILEIQATAVAALSLAQFYFFKRGREQSGEAFLLVKGFGVDDEIGTLRLFKGGIPAGELFHLSRRDFGVEPLRVPGGTSLEGGLHINFEKISVADHFAGEASQRVIRRDEGGDHNDPALGEELRHFGNTADVLKAVFIGKAEVAVQSAADVIPVKYFDETSFFVEAALEEIRERAFARSTQPVHPDNGSGLAKERFLRGAGKHLVKDGIKVIEVRAHIEFALAPKSQNPILR